jgi:hypothetical protein
VSDREARVRWQGYAREHRTAANSHFLAYAVGLLGLQASVLLDREVVRLPCPRTFALAGIAAITSLALGSIVVLIRLRDARLTAHIARYRLEKRPQADIARLRMQVSRLGKWTHRLLPGQVVLFTIAAGTLITWIVASSWFKFAPPSR